MNKEELREKAASLPLLPGVYLMKNQAGEVIYVGKAKKMKNILHIATCHLIPIFLNGFGVISVARVRK